jgi:hypothetical protein
MLIPIRWLNPSLETNDELANSAVFARIVPALAIVLLEPKRQTHSKTWYRMYQIVSRDTADSRVMARFYLASQTTIWL